MSNFLPWILGKHFNCHLEAMTTILRMKTKITCYNLYSSFNFKSYDLIKLIHLIINLFDPQYCKKYKENKIHIRPPTSNDN